MKKHCRSIKKNIICPFLFMLFLLFGVNGFGQEQPNIVYIMVDDMGYADLSCYGRKDYSTPNIDKLAADGMIFTRAYSGAPVCTPTRTAFMTGRYPARTTSGLLEPWTPIEKNRAIGLSAAAYSIATLVKNAGYETALIGKWHLGIGPSFSPIDNGFDYFYGIYSGAADYISHKGDAGLHDLYENDQPVFTKGYTTTLIGEKAVAFLQQKHLKPFFLSIQFTAPHWPWQGPEDAALPDTVPMSVKLMQSNGSPKIFKTMMKSLDDQVGLIIQAIAKNGLQKNTLVIFTSDNGGEKFSDMGPFAKSKMNVWEGGIRVPAIACWPNKIKPNSTTTQQAITMDWTATILDVSGAKPLAQYPIDGISLLNTFTGKRKNRERTFFWRLTQRTQQKAVLHHQWKWIADEKGEYLFNLTVDEAEKNNLILLNKKEAAALKKKFKNWEQTVLPPIAL